MRPRNSSRGRGKAALPACVLACIAWLLAPAAEGQSYPAKPVRYLVPMSAGSGADTIARITAAGMAQALGQQVVVENRTGGAGNIGAEVAAKSPPDGYTVFQMSMTHAVNATLYRKLAYDLGRDFSAVTLVANSPSMVVVHPSLPVKSLGELVRLAKARPGALSYASTGSGTATFIAAELFKSMARIDLLHVPYRGGGEAIIAAMTGEVPVYFAPMATSLPLARQGRLRPLAVTTPARLPALPDYPSVAELGYPGYEAGNWYGLVVPVKAPREAIAVLHGAVVAAQKNPDVAKRMQDLGYVAGGSEPGEFSRYIRAEIAKMARILKQVGATPAN
ncbi:MAG: tripartite tricarboxylate transporter substrate binding protein [Burkholderiales bacterium]|nr:tripartite tricarboxylate transporter substrate binding protein [Burkholderiales bacterium]